VVRKEPKRPQRAALVNAAALAPAQADEPAPRRRSSPMNQFELAYEAIEDRLVTCELKPGRFLALQDLQQLVGFGRTPVHQAVNRLAADTLLTVHPRRGLQVAPIDLARERVLLRLRRDVERFVIRLAAEQAGAAHRNQMLHMQRHLREHRERLTIQTFNAVDRRLDRLFLAAAGEPFVESTLRPLHTIFRRIGWIYHTQQGAAASSLVRTVDVHLALLEAVANRHVEAAIAASDQLVDFVDSMFDVLEREIDPSLLDCSLGDFEGGA